jgi:hypothetical protein
VYTRGVAVGVGAGVLGDGVLVALAAGVDDAAGLGDAVGGVSAREPHAVATAMKRMAALRTCDIATVIPRAAERAARGRSLSCALLGTRDRRGCG